MHTIGFVLYPEFSTVNFAMMTVFEMANWRTGRQAYDVRLASEHGGPVTTSLGYSIETVSMKRRRFDTIILAGAVELPRITPGLLRSLRAIAQRSPRLAATCTGAFAFAAAGLLDGRRATTHWHYAKKLQADFPAVRVEADRIFCRDGNVWTSAGMTAGIDLALALVEEDLGVETAKIVAKLLVVYHRRPGGQSQFSTLLDLSAESDRIRAALDYARKNLSARLSIEDLADHVYLSPRQFSRVFFNETGQTPARAVEQLRVESARQLVEDSDRSFDEVATMTGFGSRERLRRAFLRSFGQGPQAFRRKIRAVVRPSSLRPGGRN